jgi:hypothetical protein
MSEPSAAEWWASRRGRYNRGLALAGIGAFLCYALVLATRCANDPAVELTLFTTLFQGLGYLCAMGLANLCYNLGPWSEAVLRPTDVGRYRERAYALGFWGSVALPFGIPALVAVLGCAH